MMTEAPQLVLIVEDDPEGLKYLACLLEEWGYKVDRAYAAVEALALAKANCPAIVISDLVMPGMDGLEFLRRLKAQDPECLIFFILVTGHATVPNAVEAITEGADEVLVKPIDPDHLKFLLDKHRTKTQAEAR